MRLLDTLTGEFTWINNPTDKPYAILSHTWDGPAEQTYQDILSIWGSVEISQDIVGLDGLEKTTTSLSYVDAMAPSFGISTFSDSTGRARISILSSPRMSEKIRHACAVARADDYDALWVDSCCIDKSSSAELSEAINSMYQWYRHADVCYVYLSDVDDSDDPHAPDSQFRSARWHTRGWTLQELLAPRYVVFYSKNWRVLGTKNTLAAVVQDVTGIDRAILDLQQPLHSVSVARRMWWASSRITTRVEDEAYCLMGIFDVNMPTIYGEGRNAFARLQEEILRPWSAVSTWVDQWVDLERFTGLLRKVLTHLWRFGGGSLLVTACYSSVTAGHWYSSSVDYGLY